MTTGGPRLRILFLAPQPFFEVRGTPLAVLAMVRSLAAAGHDVDLLTFPGGEGADLGGGRHLRSLALPVGRVRPGFSFAKLILDVPFTLGAAWRVLWGRYDVVHAVEEAAHLIAPATRIRGIPLVMDVDSSIPEQLRNKGFPAAAVARLVEVVEKWALRCSAVAITVCDSLTEGVRRRAPSVPIVQIEDPPLSGVPSPDDCVRADDLRRELRIAGRPVAFYSGNFEPYQGVPLLVDAMERLPEACLVLMGGEPREIEELRSRARAGGYEERCVFVGKRPPDELPSYLALSDVVVSPRCQGQNTPFKVYTFLASGRPLVATRIPTHTQLLDDSLATLVEPTAEGLALGIRAVLSDPEGAAIRAERGRALIDRAYGPASFARKVAEAYGLVTPLLRKETRSRL